eukprot:gnl/TRDRNA2_/TRDRNA2_152047_c4_seq1.p1 gnl/TRDRNA2_/TRDRNA2_152047_c4~~gnl/TRDRNA2_/TRDRNA2_152047_c4_seq1.p1  ORF type:complete len:253 (-),score=44.31 gnl/TRDRNA2_/TRDRNA2_152047_c4_seq1:46-804(-)
MYPMDGAKLIVCSLQLFFDASAKTAAKVLIGTSGPLALLFIGRVVYAQLHGASQATGMFAGIQGYMGLMCLAEAYKIYRLLKEEQLHTHPLFELARSDTRTVGNTMRLNHEARDDTEIPTTRCGRCIALIEVCLGRVFNVLSMAWSRLGRLFGSGSSAPQPVTVQLEAPRFTELRPFEGQGQRLNASATEAGRSVTSAAGPSGGPRSSLLERVERASLERGKSVRQLEDERLERERLERQQLMKGAAGPGSV